MEPISFGSVCSGIEAASVAWNPLGWHAAWLAEIEPFPTALLVHHYPTTPNLGDMTTIARRVLTGEVAPPEVLCGGTPCQAFSVAGLRESLSDERGSLTLKFVEIADAIDDGDGFLNVTRVLEIVNRYHSADSSSRCDWCNRKILGADAGPACTTRAEATRCDALPPSTPGVSDG